MKKLSALILSAVMLVTTVFTLPFGALAWAEVDGGAIAVGDTKTVEVTAAGQMYCYTFTPSEDGTYLFYSDNIENESACDTYAYICDADDKELKSDDDGNGNGHFKLEMEMTAGTTYKLKARLYSEELGDRKFNVFLVKRGTTDGGTLSADSETKLNFSNAYETVAVKFPNTLTNGKTYYFAIKSEDFFEIDYELYSDDTRIKSASCSDAHVNSFNYNSSNEYTLKVYFHDASNTGIVDVQIYEYNEIDSGEIEVGKSYNGFFNNCAEFYEYSFTVEKDGYYFFEVFSETDAGSNINGYNGNGEEHNIVAYLPAGTYRFTMYEHVNQTGEFFFNVSEIAPTASGTLSLSAATDVEYAKNSIMRYSFTPQQSAVYSFTTQNTDTYGYLYDENEKQLAFANDVSSGNRNFMITRYLEKDKTYYLDARLYTIENDGEFKIIVSDATETHEHDYIDKAVDPTCTEQGYTLRTCKKCGYVCKDDFVDALGHDLENEVNTPATLTANGSYSADCKRCGEHFASTYYRPATFRLAKTEYVYTGKAIKPAVTVTDVNGAKMDAANYTVKYTGNTNVGTATVTITFTGDYSGTKKLTFKINPKGTTVTKVTSPKKAQLKVTWKKQATQTTGYQLQYSTDKNFKKGVKSVNVTNSKTTAKTISKLSSKKKYFVRIRTYKTVGKTKYYSAWSAAKNVKVK